MARICVIRQGDFPIDPRVRREVEALLDCGHEVDVICQYRAGEPAFERRHGGRLTIRRLPIRHSKGGPLVEYLGKHALFVALAGALAGARHLRRRYDLVQVNTIPDTLVFAALLPRLLGARVLLDLHECMPEFYASKFKAGMRHPAARLIGRVEQLCIRFAHQATTCTDQMRDAFLARGADPEKVTVVANGPDEGFFDANLHPARGREPGRFVLICHGSVEERYGLDTIVKAVAVLKGEIPGLRLDVYGEGGYVEELRRLVRDLGVEDIVYVNGAFVPRDELLRTIAAADAGVVAMKRDVFRDLTLCNKMYDYVAMRKPALVSRTRSVEETFDESCFAMFTADDVDDLVRAIRELHADPALGERLVPAATRASEPYRWPHQREIYRGVVERLLGARKGAARRGAEAPAAGD